MRLFWVFHLVGDVAFFLAGACCGAALTTGVRIMVDPATASASFSFFGGDC